MSARFFSFNSPVKLTIRREAKKLLLQGYPWVYAQSFKELPPAERGSFAIVRDSEGRILAKGFYDPTSPLVFRTCSLEEHFDDSLILSRLEQATRLRSQLYNSSTTAYRVINGEGDLIPGLIVDRYDSVAVMQLDGEGPRVFWNIEALASEIAKCLKLSAVYLKPRARESHVGQALVGALPTESVIISENSLRFSVDIVHGQKTGFFLDQRENRAFIQACAQDKKMLNLCSYTGGFSIASGVGGASHVTSVDCSKPAITEAERNWALNDLPPAHHRGVVADAFEFTEEEHRRGSTYDLIVVDPPSFIHNQRDYAQGREAYRKLYCSALNLLPSGGIIAFSSCSSHLLWNDFESLIEECLSLSKRSARALRVAGQPYDHPYPLACPTLRYLKFLALCVQ